VDFEINRIASDTPWHTVELNIFDTQIQILIVQTGDTNKCTSTCNNQLKHFSGLHPIHQNSQLFQKIQQVKSSAILQSMNREQTEQHDEQSSSGCI